MESYQHILITTDLSPQSTTVADRGLLLKQALNCHLSIVHVIESNPRLYGLGEFALPIDLDLEGNIHQQAKTALEKESQRLGIPPDSLWLMQGAKTDEIIELVASLKIDLILVGAHDKHGVELLFSDTAESLLHALPCDVIAVKVSEA